MKLVIGNKNYSSWSLRPWLLLTHLGIPFQEEKLSFGDAQFKERVRRHSPTGQVPVLVDGDVVVWDSLAIVEYVAEVFPERGVWPTDRHARAYARSICAEMHAGFAALRQRLQMNCELRLSQVPLEREVRRDVARIVEIWSSSKARFGAGGPFLFGAFCAADAYYAPVVSRFISYGIPLPAPAQFYVDTMAALPAMAAWMTSALAENDFVDREEPYRDSPR